MMYRDFFEGHKIWDGDAGPDPNMELAHFATGFWKEMHQKREQES
jgi:hypothetical protein